MYMFLLLIFFIQLELELQSHIQLSVHISKNIKINLTLYQKTLHFTSMNILFAFQISTSTSKYLDI